MLLLGTHRLSPADQKLIQEAAAEARDYERKVSREQAANAVAGLMPCWQKM